MRESAPAVNGAEDSELDSGSSNHRSFSPDIPYPEFERLQAGNASGCSGKHGDTIARMSARRLRTFTLWTGTTLSLLIAVVFVVSWLRPLGAMVPGGHLVGVRSGALEFMQLRSTVLFSVTWAPVFALPLIYPFAAVAIPTLLVWRFVPKFPSGHCRRCGYNLKGNTTGRCSECGAEFGRDTLEAGRCR